MAELPTDEIIIKLGWEPLNERREAHFLSLVKKVLETTYRKIPKISPGAYVFQGPFLRGLFLNGLIYGGKFVFQNRLG